MTLPVKCSPESVIYLNLGCGDTYFPEWNNCDLLPRRHINSVDLRRPLPFAADTFDAVYCSHLLEHLVPAAGERLVNDIMRVLRPGGVVRIVVPDLQQICALYLQTLADVERDHAAHLELRYRWMLIELLDQMVRDTSGGMMRSALREHRFDDFVAEQRLGDSFMPHVDPQRPVTSTLQRSDITGLSRARPDPLGIRLRRALLKWRLKLTQRSDDPRHTGEAHRWMYDAHSLAMLLRDCGFDGCRVTDYANSRIPHWDKYNLDVSRYGDRPRKPDSLYMEALKPA